MTVVPGVGTTAIGSGSELAEASTETAGSAAGPMAQVRPGEPPGVMLARARVFGALFGEDSTLGSFGRFRVLERLGAGGMGVVYEAYDPDLARGVALKLVDVTAKDRDTALAEAKALARLSHPNVVPIFDVGIECDHVYLVMELVRGKTLRRWAEGRSARDILAVYHQAGTALAAAHAAGLVHRDFKPENAIVGADGRVRVVDFGLACEADDPARASGERRGIAGTPGFMAPEITAGTAITAAADQFSFCVALADALAVASPPATRRIAAVLERGRASDPAARFASMTELLHALARDPARIWRRRLAAATLLVGVGVTSYAIGLPRDSCALGAELQEATWSGGARAAALDRIATLGPYGVTLRPLLESKLDVRREGWVRAYRAACTARRRGTQSDAQVDRRNICLTRSIDDLEAVRDLVSQVEPDKLAQLPLAVQSMHDPAACSERNTALSDLDPPLPAVAVDVARVRHDIALARVGVGAGRYSEALHGAGAAVHAARGLAYPPVLAEALLVQGHAQMMLEDRRAAVPILDEATRVAYTAGAYALAVEAWARRAWAQGTSNDPAGALAGLEWFEPLAQRSDAEFARALLYNNVGVVELAMNDPDKARNYLVLALAASRKVTDDGALELLAILANIGILSPDRVQGDKLLVDVAAERERRLGASHPDTLEVQWLRGITTIENLARAAEVVTPACAAYEQHEALADRRAQCWTEVGLLRWDLGDRNAAIAAMEHAAAAGSATQEPAAWLLFMSGDAPAAVQRFSDTLAARAAAPDAAWWEAFSQLSLKVGLGRARRAAGDLRGARAVLEEAEAGFDAIARKQSATIYDRQRGRVRVELAQVLSENRASPADRARVDDAARAWLQRVGAPPSDLDATTAAGSAK